MHKALGRGLESLLPVTKLSASLTGKESISDIPIDKIKPKRKENIILFVGRFSQLEQAKNQHILVDIFKKFYKSGYNNWKLILAGGTEVGAEEYLLNLKKQVGNYPIEISESPNFNALKNLYGTAKIFWSAVGYGVDEEKTPKKVEHFGMSLIEAMTAGCVPLVYSAGGYKEIIKDGDNGYLWNNSREILRNTKLLIKNNNIYRTISDNAKKDSKKYSYEKFAEQVKNILH